MAYLDKFLEALNIKGEFNTVVANAVASELIKDTIDVAQEGNNKFVMDYSAVDKALWGDSELKPKAQLIVGHYDESMVKQFAGVIDVAEATFRRQLMEYVRDNRISGMYLGSKETTDEQWSELIRYVIDETYSGRVEHR